MGKERPIKYYFAGIVAVLFWGTAFSFSKQIVDNPLSPINLSALRTLIGTCVLILYILISGNFKDFIIVLKKNYKKFILIGIFSYSAAYIIQFSALSRTTASHQAIIGQTQTFWVVIYNYLFLKLKPSKKFILGFIITFIGVSFIIFSSFSSQGTSTILGDLLSVFAFALWGSYTFSTKSISTDERPLFVSASILICATVFLIPLSLFFGISAEIMILTPLQWGILFWLGTACIGLSFILWSFALSNKNIGAEKISIITMLQPVVGVITSAIILGEIIDLNVILGLILVLLGLIIANWFKKADPLR